MIGILLITHGSFGDDTPEDRHPGGSCGKITSLDQYEIPAESIPNCAPDAEGKKLLCDGYRILDARANIRDTAKDVIEKVRILRISSPIPNDTLSFGKDFPPDGGGSLLLYGYGAYGIVTGAGFRARRATFPGGFPVEAPLAE